MWHKAERIRIEVFAQLKSIQQNQACDVTQGRGYGAPKLLEKLLTTGITFI